MIDNELKINGKDAYAEYGLFMTQAGLNALRAPRTPKEPISSASRLENGKRVILPRPDDNATPLFESREFSMEVCMSSKTVQLFNQRLAKLESDLAAGWLAITTAHVPGTIYWCRYVSTSSFTIYQGRAAKLVLKFEEPNPAHRS